MPRIIDGYLHCVIYLYPDERSAREGERAGGTGFLIGESLVPGSQVRWLGYIVTNAHIIDGGSCVVRLNSAAGGTEILSTDERSWHRLNDGTDLAICLVELEQSVHLVTMLSRAYLLTKEWAAKINLGPGDDVALIGRYINNEGKQKNLPTIRFGSIAQMPYEQIECAAIAPQESFLVEVRAIGGYSGSPVFVQFPEFRRLKASEGPPRLSWLLGVEWCLFHEWSRVCDGNGHPWKNGDQVAVHTGMCGVIPSWKLLELLDSEGVVTAKNDAMEEIRKRRKPSPPVTMLTGAHAVKSAHPTTEQNPRHREDFSQLVTAAVKKPQQDG
ncbi:MAG: trypsin-like peptidase domain-containing protein [Alphaproteobacteria bacterium]|nr:trypsin-like peptidase domain-containing protein [Alphaproteobacteria bacterium]